MEAIASISATIYIVSMKNLSDLLLEEMVNSKPLNGVNHDKLFQCIIPNPLESLAYPLRLLCNFNLITFVLHKPQ